MNINPISFKGTYCIPINSLTKKSCKKLFSKSNEYGMVFEPGTSMENNKLYIHSPQEYDNNITQMLISMKLPFQSINPKESLDNEAIHSRIFLSDFDKHQGNILIDANTQILDNALKNNPKMYVGINGKNGSGFRYERFKRYLKTNQPITATSVYLRRGKNGQISAHVNDGRHRFAVLRDMGFEKIPVSITKDSIELAREINLI